MNARLRQWLLTGLLAVTPAAITGWILWRFYRLVDGALRPWVERFPYLREHVAPFLMTMLGVVVSLMLLTLIGMVTRTLIGVAFFGLLERALNRIPIIKSIFSVTKQIAEVLLADNRRAFQKVVMFEYPRRGIWSLGFVTHDDPGRESLHVFLPTTPNPTSGYLLVIPREDAIALPLSVEEGIRLIISGGSVITPAHSLTLEEAMASKRALPGRDAPDGGGGEAR